MRPETNFKEFPKNMKHSVSAICLLASGLGLSALAQTASTPASMPSAPAPAASHTAAPAGASKVAVILFEAAVGQTNEGQRDIAQVQKKFAPKEAALKAQNDEIDTLKKQLQSGAATFSEAEKASRSKTIDQKEKQLQLDADGARTDYQSEMGDVLQTLAQKVFVVAQKYAQDNGYSLVLDGSATQQQQSPILWASEQTNITKEVIDAYNAQSGVPPQPAPTTAAPRSTPSTPRATPKTPPSK
jgi:outer membrane protein